MRFAIQRADVENPDRASRHAVAASITDILLHHYRIELCSKQSPGRACFQTGRIVAMFADIAHHQPAALEWKSVVGAHILFNKPNMPPRAGGKRTGVVVALAS